MGDIFLPTELIYSILYHIESLDDLLTLAITCRTFSPIALDVIFTRQRLDPISPNLALTIDKVDNNGSLSALSLWSQRNPNHRLQKLEFTFGPYTAFLRHVEGVYRSVRTLTNYIRRLSSVDDVSLTLVAPTKSTSPDLGRATVELLQAILDKQCKTLQVSSLRIIDQGLYGPQSQIPVLTPPDVKFVDNPTDWVWRKLYNTTSDPTPVKTTQKGRLTQFVMNGFPVFLRQFYSDALQASSSTLTELSFVRIFDGADDWKTLMSSLRLPNLRVLRIKVCIILQEPLVRFLSNHRELKVFQYHHIKYHKPTSTTSSTSLSSTIFQHLEELHTTPRHLLSFFPSVATLLALRTVIINMEVLSPDFSAVKEAMTTLQGCTNRVDLTLHITAAGLGIEAWMQTMDVAQHPPPGPGAGGGTMGTTTTTATTLDQRPERLLYPIKSLTLYNGSWGWTVGLVVRVMRWVALFPALEEVVFDAHPSTRNVVRFPDDVEVEEVLMRDLERGYNGSTSARTIGVMFRCKEGERERRIVLNGAQT